VFQTSTSVRPTLTTVLTVRSASTSTAASAVWTMSPTLLVSPVQFSSSFLWWWACLSVCLSVCSHIFACLRNYTSELHQVSRAINCDHGSAVCECDSERESAEHFLLRCIRFQDARNKLIHTVNEIFDLSARSLQLSENLLLAPMSAVLQGMKTRI